MAGKTEMRVVEHHGSSFQNHGNHGSTPLYSPFCLRKKGRASPARFASRPLTLREGGVPPFLYPVRCGFPPARE